MQRGVKKCVYAKIYLIEHIVPKLFDLCIYLRTLQKLVLMKDFPQKSWIIRNELFIQAYVPSIWFLYFSSNRWIHLYLYWPHFVDDDGDLLNVSDREALWYSVKLVCLQCSMWSWWRWPWWCRSLRPVSVGDRFVFKGADLPRRKRTPTKWKSVRTAQCDDYGDLLGETELQKMI